MADLRGFASDLGFADVKTLLASGNLVFACDEDDLARLERRLEHEAAARLGLTTEFLLRNATDLDTAIAANPFADAASERPSHLLVHFHRDPFPATLLADLDAAYAGPERLSATGRELFVDYPHGVGDSKLPQAMARLKFPQPATARNWNTVLKLRALLD